mmetsp:Transcript_3224/g.7073  ORF Transcript_3224/g.7073 Transcript_3224/m.7073 type:complete len:529 (+) Transcript_3224:307-1893(+)
MHTSAITAPGITGTAALSAREAYMATEAAAKSAIIDIMSSSSRCTSTSKPTTTTNGAGAATNKHDRYQQNREEEDEAQQNQVRTTCTVTAEAIVKSTDQAYDEHQVEIAGSEHVEEQPSGRLVLGGRNSDSTPSREARRIVHPSKSRRWSTSDAVGLQKQFDYDDDVYSESSDSDSDSDDDSYYYGENNEKLEETLTNLSSILNSRQAAPCGTTHVHAHAHPPRRNSLSGMKRRSSHDDAILVPSDSGRRLMSSADSPSNDRDDKQKKRQVQVRTSLIGGMRALLQHSSSVVADKNRRDKAKARGIASIVGMSRGSTPTSSRPVQVRDDGELVKGLSSKDAQNSHPSTGDNDSDGISPQDLLVATIKARGGDATIQPALSIENKFHTHTEEEIASYPPTAMLIRNGDFDGLKKAHEAGLNLQAANKFGESLLHIACRRGYDDVATFLVEAANVTIWVRDDFGRTPLHDACWTARPNLELMDLFVRRNPELLLVSDKRGNTPLDYVRREHWDLWRQFLEDRWDCICPVN